MRMPTRLSRAAFSVASCEMRAFRLSTVSSSSPTLACAPSSHRRRFALVIRTLISAVLLRPTGGSGGN